jgi:hypothetical protein
MQNNKETEHASALGERLFASAGLALTVQYINILLWPTFEASFTALQ